MQTDEGAGKSKIGTIVAARDGVIREMTVYNGFPVCNVGQAVQEGQILVSGYEDKDLFRCAGNVDAEIFADTKRDITVQTPGSYSQKTEIIDSEKNYSIIFGKKRINLFKDTGISDACCVKMYKQYYMCLPGGFILPLSVIEYTKEMYRVDAVTVKDEDSCFWIKNTADQYIKGQMLSGSILNREEELYLTPDLCIYDVTYTCREMIGQYHNGVNYKKNE